MKYQPQNNKHTRTVSIFNASTYYFEYGNIESLHTIILIHGFRGDHHGLELIANKLTEYRVIVPDLPGCGLSDAFPELPHTIQTYNQWFTSFITHLNIKGKLVIVGHSFGSILVSAALSTGLAADYLILINPLPVRLAHHQDLGTLITKYYYWLVNKVSSPFDRFLIKNQLVIRMMSSIMVKTTDKPLRKWIHQQHAKFFGEIRTKKSLIEMFEIIKHVGVADYAKEIKQPTLLLVGERDNLSSVTLQQRLIYLFYNADLHIISNLGHLLHYEAPDEVANYIKLFLRNNVN